MTVESALYPPQLNTSWPQASDMVSEGDNHIRLTKTVIKTTFPNVAGVVSATDVQLSYVTGVTSAIQAQLDSKGAIAGQTWTGTHVFPSTTTIGGLTPTIRGYLETVTSDAQAQINARAVKAGDTYSGAHDFTGATITVQTATAGDSTNKAASTAFVAGTAFSAALPGQAGNAGKFVKTNGTTASWSFIATSDLTAGDVPALSLNGGQLAGLRNKITNGNFGINQRGYVSGAATTAGQYTLDRWKVTGTGGITFSTTDNKTTVTIPSGQTLQQVIEGLDIESGSYVLSWGGTAQGRINGGSYGASGAVTAAITGGTNTTIEFNAGTVASVMFEKSSAATVFEHRPYGFELSLCQRYYQAHYGSGSGAALAARGAPGAGNALWLPLMLPVEMRAAPTAAVVGTWSVSNCPQPTISQAAKSNVTVFSNATAAGDAYFFSSAATVGVTLSAEL